MNKLKRHLKLYPMILLAIMAWSCVRVEEPRKSWQRTPMVITRDQRGVTLHLTTVKDQRYNILYQDPAPGGGKTDWKILPNAREIRGTGDVVEIFDDDPRARRRNYRQQTLLAMPASKVPPQLR
ncbi:MAG: hypothetical protein JJU29_11790 [Verrucomicrobia bacterium]|nr:hypothetical protein [Verrucomicrobiota bacterium]MCH8513699.1 hypothetical protein [Kiritimatiellia bacterium]